MSDETGNRVSSKFETIDDLTEGIKAARTFGMRDLTVTTVHHPSGRNAQGVHVGASTAYYLDCSMLTDRAPDDERNLGYVADCRATIEQAKRRVSA